MKYIITLVFILTLCQYTYSQNSYISGGIGRAQFTTGDISSTHWRINYSKRIKNNLFGYTGLNYTTGSRDIVGLDDRPLTLSSPDTNCPFDGFTCFGINFSDYSKLLKTKTTRSSEFNIDIGIQYLFFQSKSLELSLSAGIHRGQLDYHSITAVLPGDFERRSTGEITEIDLLLPVAFRAIDWGHNYNLAVNKIFSSGLLLGLVTDTHIYFSGDGIFSVSLVLGYKF